MENNEEVQVFEPRLKHFPVMMFAVVMGLSGLALVYQKAALWLGYPKIIADVLAFADVAIFGIITLLYIAKAIKYPKSIKNEFAHPVRVNFFAAIAISLLLVSSLMHEYGCTFSVYVWYAGAIWEAYMTLHVISYWVNKNVEIKHSNPAWLIPVVGNVIVPLSGVGYVSNALLFYFLTIGIFFWVILLAILLNRIIFHHQLVQKFVPTLFILLAPPAAGMISYVKIFGFDLMAQSLYNIALFFSFLLLFMAKNFVNIKFFISWWAFTFPVAAMSIASLLAFHKSGESFYEIVSHISVAVTTIVVAYVAYHTIKHIFKKEICIQE